MRRQWRVMFALGGLLAACAAAPRQQPAGLAQGAPLTATVALPPPTATRPPALSRGATTTWLPMTFGWPGTTLAVIGDYGLDGEPPAQVGALVAGWQPEAVFTLGDNNYQVGGADTIDRHIGQYYHSFIAPYGGTYGPGAATNRFFPALGNHDWLTAGAQPYLDYFQLPNNERYYEVAIGPTRWFVLDSDPQEPDGVSSTSIQAAWLQARLAAATECWKIVTMHHPPYSSGTHGPTAWMQWPFKEWGADLVLAGHDHTYERIIRDDFPYIVNGLGGAGRYNFNATPVAGSVVRYNEQHGAMRVIASPAALTSEFIAIGGAVADTYQVPGGCAPAAP